MKKTAYLLPGQGAQYPGMGKLLYEKSSEASGLFKQANKILGKDIISLMCEGSADDLQQTTIAQPAIFLYSVITSKIMLNKVPGFIAGHSLGEITALVVGEYCSFEDGLCLVAQRAQAMQKACNITKGTMAAVLGLEDIVVEKICATTTTVRPANYNSPGQVVIAGKAEEMLKVYEQLRNAGAKRVVPLAVNGAFHSPWMQTAVPLFAAVLDKVTMHKGKAILYQNVNAQPTQDVQEIKKNLVSQITAPVLWKQLIQNMIQSGCQEFITCGPGNVLGGLVKKIGGKDIQVYGVSD